MSSSLKLKCELCRKGSPSAFLVQKKKQAPGRSIVKNPKSSLARNGRVPLPTLYAPRYSLATRSTCSASAFVLAVMGWLEVWRSQANPSSLMSSSSSLSLPMTAGSISWSKDRSVPSMLTDSEMTLKRSPEWKTGSVQTKNLPLLCLSSSMNCINFWQRSTAFQMATFSFSGSLPCPPVPVILILMTVILLMTAPSLHQMSPKLPTGQLWNPQTSSTPSRQPCFIISSAPDSGPSSLGWNSSRTHLFLGSESSLLRKSGTKPMRQAMCPSWPHMWAAPLFFDSYSRCGFSSVIESASMSALKATQQSLPFGSAFPLRSTTSAVGCSGLMASSGTPNSSRMPLMRFWVSNSTMEISGKLWISLLNWIILWTMAGSMLLIDRQQIQIDMSFQFKVRPKENPHEECEKEISLLKGYNQALEKENQSRNIERQAMQAEIERLTRLQREWKEKGTVSSSRVVNIYENHEYVELKQSYLDVKAKYEKTLLENSTLTTKLISAEVSQSRLVSLQDEKTRLNEVIKSLETKLAALEGKVVGYEREVTELKTRQSSSVIISRQQQSEAAKIEDLERQVRSKGEEVVRLQRELSIKEEQLSGFKRDIASYALKIDALSEQLGKLERTQRVEIRYVEKEETLVLRSKLEQINNINGSLSLENNSLRIERTKQAELIKDLERRIAILEDTNANLQNELRLAIDHKKTASRVELQEDKSLKEAVFALKAELEEVRRFNQLVRQENDELYAQMQGLKSSKCHRCQHRHRSKSPLRQQEDKVARSKLAEQAATHSHVTHSHTRHSHNCNHASQASIAPKAHHHHIDKSRLEGSLGTGERYLDLQRKIQLLQSENQVLKQHLVYEI